MLIIVIVTLKQNSNWKVPDVRVSLVSFIKSSCGGGNLAPEIKDGNVAFVSRYWENSPGWPSEP